MTTLIDGLAAYWKLEEASGTRVDAHRSNDLTPANSPGSDTGAIGDGCEFVRTSSQYLYSTASELATGDVDFTIGCWVKLASKPGANMMMVTKDTTSNREFFLSWDYSADRFVFHIVNNSSGMTGVTADALGSPTVDTWYHIVAWHNAAGNQIGIRINDAYEDTEATGYAPGGPGAQFCVGRRQFPPYEKYFDGVIDEVGFWKRLLTSEEKTALYNGGAGRQYPFNIGLHDGLVDAWHLEEDGASDRKGAAKDNDLMAWNSPGLNSSGIWQGAMTTDAAKAAYCADNAQLSTGNIPFTFSVWVYMTSKPADYQGIIGKWHAAGGPNEYLLYYDFLTDRFLWSPGGFNVFANALGSPSLSTWYHILCWYDPYLPEAGIRVDDTYENIDTSGASPPDSDDEFDIGTFDNRNNADIGFRGSIDEVVFWKRLLTPGEKTAIYNGGSAKPYPWGSTSNRTLRGICRGVGRGT